MKKQVKMIILKVLFLGAFSLGGSIDLHAWGIWEELDSLYSEYRKKESPEEKEKLKERVVSNLKCNTLTIKALHRGPR